MPVELALNTPLSEALQAEILSKLAEVGWGSGDESNDNMAEYIILMIINGKTQDQIAAELSGELLGLGSDDPTAKQFAVWLFEQLDILNARLNGQGQGQGEGEAMAVSQDDSTTMGAEDQEMDLTAGNDSLGEINAPTGPKAMRNGANPRGGREKRIVGQINRALDRSHDSVLHRIRGQSGNERVNSHARTPPSGPSRGGMVGRQPRNMNGRAASIAHGLATGMGGMNGMNGNWMAGPTPPGMDVYSMLEQQSRMMAQMQQQMHQQQQMLMQPRANGSFNQHGRPLSDRVQHPRQNNRQGAPHHSGANHAKKEQAAEGEDVDMSGAKREPLNPDETVCKYNLSCTNKECKFAHQSSAAPPGTTVDIHDVCSFGAACKNRKCVGRHPSPASKMAHQNEQDCKFFPNCTNPRCPFRHPSMPVCRNGADCAVPGCKFTHVKTMCKFNPCTNRYCPFKHEEGQRGVFQDKVWTAEGGKEHVSERKFVDEGAAEDNVIPGQDKEMATEATTVA